MSEELAENDITQKIIGAAVEVHRIIGPGLKEEVYESALAVELGLRGMEFRRQVPVLCHYKGVRIDEKNHPKAIDILAEECVVVECKAVSVAKDPVFRAQCLTYMRMMGVRVGLVINFGRPTLIEGITRVVNSADQTVMRLPHACGLDSHEKNSATSA